MVEDAILSRDGEVVVVHEDDPDRPSATLPNALQANVGATNDSPYE